MPATTQPTPTVQPISEKKTDNNSDMPAVENPTPTTADAPANNVVKPAEDKPAADAPAAENAPDAPPADTPAVEKPAETPTEANPASDKPADAPAADEPANTGIDKPADVPADAAAPDGPAPPAAEADTPAKKEAQPPPGGVRFGNVEIVAPSEPAAAPVEGNTADDDDDAADEDFEVEDAAAAAAEEEDAAEMEGVKIPENMPELPKGLLSQLLANGSLGNKVLHKAAADGDVEEVRKLLADDGEMKGLINDLDMFAYTPLHIAAENGKLEVCKVLIELKADVNASTKMYSSTALHYGMS